MSNIEIEQLRQLLRSAESRLIDLESSQAESKCQLPEIIDLIEDTRDEQPDESKVVLHQCLNLHDVRQKSCRESRGDTNDTNQSSEAQLKIRIKELEKQNEELTARCSELGKTTQQVADNLKEETKRAGIAARAMLRERVKSDLKLCKMQQRLLLYKQKIKTIRGKSIEKTKNLKDSRIKYERVQKKYEVAKREIESLKRKYETEDSLQADDSSQDVIITYEKPAAQVQTRNDVRPSEIRRSTWICRICHLRFDNGKAFRDHWQVHKTNRERTRKKSTAQQPRTNGGSTHGHRKSSSSSARAGTKDDHYHGNYLTGACSRSYRSTRGERAQTRCKLCGARFHTRRQLSLHLLDHTGKLYPCTLCGKSLLFKSNLSRHVREIHYGIRPFSCKPCGKRFKRMESLRRHRLTCRNISRLHRKIW